MISVDSSANMKTSPTRKQVMAGGTAITLLLFSMVAKEIVVEKHRPRGAHFTAQAARSPVQHVIDLDAHHFRGIRAHQQLWNPQEKEDVLTIAKLGERYHRAISEVDLDSCPKAFWVAYAAHTKEWQEIAKALTAAVSKTTDPDELAKEVRRITKPLETTWAQVQSKAQAANVYVKE